MAVDKGISCSVQNNSLKLAGFIPELDVVTVNILHPGLTAS